MFHSDTNTFFGVAAGEQPAIPHVLVVDDNDPLLSVLSETLQGVGMQVTTASGAAYALSILSGIKPDVIVCDIMMPEMDGFQFQEEILKNPEWADIPFVFLSALNTPDEVRYGKSRGCDDYITKPFDPTDLVSVIHGKLQLSKERRRQSEQRALDARRRIIHTLSHEFRTPLVAISTGSELLREQFKSLDETRIYHLIESIHRGGQRLQRLIDDFMTLQQIDSGLAETAHQKLCRDTSVVSLVEQSVDGFEDAHPGDRLCLQLNLPNEAVPVISVYDAQVLDALRRLLSNSRKFGGSDKPVEITVALEDFSAPALDAEVGSDTEMPGVAIHIRDHGAGIPAEALQQICQMFTQVDREKLEQQGCGLGLSIASYFVKLNGGRLDFKNLPNQQGFEVTALFPLVS